jgi:hypothetical protein
VVLFLLQPQKNNLRKQTNYHLKNHKEQNHRHLQRECRKISCNWMFLMSLFFLLLLLALLVLLALLLLLALALPLPGYRQGDLVLASPPLQHLLKNMQQMLSGVFR